MSEHLDVVVVGAGLSGIAAGYRLAQADPRRSWAILEGREASGGTWDLFRYPGVRSDSDMSTLGFPFEPWTGAETVADGDKIRSYIDGVAERHGLAARIRFRHKVIAASWSRATARWTLTVQVGADGRRERLTCRFLYLATGYFDYERPHLPDFPGEADFAGQIIHPQLWPPDLRVRGRRAVVVGSGATAVTLVPALAQRGAQVTMLQRTPSWVMPVPCRDAVVGWAHRVLPSQAAGRLIRWKNILTHAGFYELTRRRPAVARSLLRRAAHRALGDASAVREHFTPGYRPWDQRLCVAPGGDLYAALRDGRADIVTDTLERFTTNGIRLSSGRELAADIVVAATGLRVRLAGGIRLDIDGVRQDLASLFLYRGTLLGGVPNVAVSLGYVNAAWTLRADLAAQYVCRLLGTMDAQGWTVAMPVPPAGLEPRPLLPLTSSYVRRAEGSLPSQGHEGPWVMRHNYLRDRWEMMRADVREHMSFR